MTHEEARTIMRRIAVDDDRLAKIAEAQIRNVVVCHLSVVSLRICFSFNADQWVARSVCPATQAANFGLLDLQLTEADRHDLSDVRRRQTARANYGPRLCLQEKHEPRG
jgi:hypothetical protein